MKNYTIVTGTAMTIIKKLDAKKESTSELRTKMCNCERCEKCVLCELYKAKTCYMVNMYNESQKEISLLMNRLGEEVYKSISS